VDAIGDFTSLTAHVTSIDVTAQGGGTTSLSPKTSSFDLTKLTSANQSLFNGSLAAGTYSRVELKIASASGVLRASGQTVNVSVPSGGLFLNDNFTIAAGKTTTFLFDIQVHKLGNGGYQFFPSTAIGGSSGPH
jgi:filamentous hemagglutinin family protein